MKNNIDERISKAQQSNDYIYFDIGANNGCDSIPIALANNNARVYAFEPTPELIMHLTLQTAGMANYNIIPKAVSNFNGTTTFYISGQGDWGCSSMNEFNDNLEKTWPGRTDFNVTNKITVPVITMKDFVETNNISHIDFLHVDAQGQDLEVLMGFGDKLSIVKEGVIEMPMSHDTKLYKNQKYLVSDAVLFLMACNFQVVELVSNDPQNNEINIHFLNLKYNI
jgi:FkbM family methyltransferase